MYKPTESKGLGKFWLISIGIHIGILLLALIGTFIPRTMPDVAPPPIYVEFAPVAETAKAPTEGKQIQSTKKKEPEPEPLEEKKPQPKAAKEPTPPEPPKEEKKKEEPKKEDKKTAEKTKESTKAEKKPQEKKKEEKKVEKKDTKEQQQSFDALLKNLADTKDDTKAGAQDVKASDAPTDEPSGLPDYAAELTISEFDALRAQLAQCWNIPAGAQDAENLVIEVKVDVNESKIATRASVVDQIRYNTDSYFRAAADSAVRAVQSPDCTPLELPDGKYSSWKSMIIVFDPREMF